MAFEDSANRFVRWGLDRWHSVSGLIAVLVGILLAGVAFFAGINVANLTNYQWFSIAIALLVATGFWWRTRIARVSSKRLGFGVAISFEEHDETKRLKADFVDTLKQLLKSSETQKPFEFVDFSPAISKRVANDDQYALSVSEKANLSFLIYGRARVRKTGGVESHVLDLKWAVRHAPIQEEQSRQLSREAGALFPKRVIVHAGDLLATELAAQLIEGGVRYVIGCAAVVSRDFEFAERMLLEAEVRIGSRLESGNAATASLLGKIRAKIAENYLEWALTYVNRYTFQTRDKGDLARAEPIINKLRKYDPNNYPARQAMAMIAFVIREDAVTARRELEHCKQEADGTWRYNEAFLLAYDGDLEGAYRAYQKAFDAPLSEDSVPNQCEEFIQIVLDEQPHRPWLYFCAGLINYRAKGDLIAARKDFQNFIRVTADPRFSRHIDIAKGWITSIENRLQANNEDSEPA